MEMDKITYYDELQKDSQAYGEHLDRLLIASMGIILATLGYGAAFYASSLAERAFRPFVEIGGVLLVVALLPSCVLYLSRSNVTPSPDRRALSPGLHRYCAENSAWWNRLRLHMLGAAWFTIFVVGALVVIALSIGTSASTISWQRSHVLGFVLALFAAGYTLYGYVHVGLWLFGRREKELRLRLVAGDVFDLGGYGLTRRQQTLLDATHASKAVALAARLRLCLPTSWAVPHFIQLRR